MKTQDLLPEGTDRVVSWLRSSADSPVGKGLLVRKLQYEVREGGDGDEVMIIPGAFIADRDSSFILLEVVSDEECI